jgi:hypothetical protein
MGNRFKVLFHSAWTGSFPGRLNIPVGAGYQIGTGTNIVTPAADGSFNIPIAADMPGFVWAFREPGDALFMAMVVPSMNQVTIDSASTAVGLALLSPFVRARDEDYLKAARDALLSFPETATLAEAIRAAGAAGKDYLPEPSYQNALVAVIQKFLAQGISASSLGAADFKTGTPRDTALKDLNPENGAATIRLKSTLETSPANTNQVKFKLDKFGSNNALSARGNNPLDWIVEIYELDPKQFPEGKANVDALTPIDSPKRLRNGPVATGFVRASLASKKLDLLKLAADALADLMFASVEEKPNEFLFDKRKDAVYVSHAFSGNLWYGTEFFAVGPNANQINLLNRIDGNSIWTKALALNTTLAAIDVVSLGADPSNFIDKPDRWVKFLFSIANDVEKEIQDHHAAGDFDNTIYLDVTKKAVAATLKFTMKEALGAGVKKLGEGLIKTFLDQVNLLGKVSKAEQVLERSAALITFTTLAVERSVIIVGNPFTPQIRSFEPSTGHGGDVITITGDNFPDNTRDVKVSFCTFASTANPDLATALPVKVMAAAPHSIAVIVPTNWSSSFPSGKAFICIEGTNGVRTTTIGLPSPHEEFIFQRAPRLFAFNTNPARSGMSFSVTGTNFGVDSMFMNKFVIDGKTVIDAAVGDGGMLIGTMPSLPDGAHTIAVRISGDTSDPLPFTLETPASDARGYKRGLTITVGKADMSNSPDGEISLLEAILIANGTLGRPIEQHLPCEALSSDDPNHCAPRQREEDSIAGLDENGGGGGPASRDVIVVSSKVRGQTIFVGGNLPPVTNGDTYQLFNVVLDGGGVAKDGFVLSKTEGVTLSGFTIKNFKGNGVRLTDGAWGNIVRDVTVENAGLSGFFLDGSATVNELFNIVSTNAARNGLELAGSGVFWNSIWYNLSFNNNFPTRFEKSGEYGVLIRDGARFNSIYPGAVNNNEFGGIYITGAETDYNIIGPHGDPYYAPRTNPLYRNGGPGLYIGPGVDNTLVSFLNPAGNQGDGILVEGGVRNTINGTVTSLDLYSGPQPVPLPNQGNGIHLWKGSHDNLVGSLLPGSFGGRAMIVANRDDGVLLEGTDTYSNTVNRAHVGSIEPFFIQKAYPNGLNGIHIRGGSHHNMLGAFHSYLDLHIMGSIKAGILIEGTGSDFNRIIGNQIGDNHEEDRNFSFREKNTIGIHLKDRAKGNVIGVPGEMIQFFLPPDEFVFRFANVIANCKEAGILLENCGGQLDALGELIHPNMIQNNSIGEEDFGSIGANRVGITISADAQGNMIGGPKEAEGNRIRFSDKAGVNVFNSLVDSYAMRNRFMNNVIEFSGGISCFDPFFDYWGAGVIIEGQSEGAVFGESVLTPNVIEGNCVGVYIEQSHSNLIQGTLITNNYNAGIFLDGSRLNRIGGDQQQQRVVIDDNGSSPGLGGIVIAGGSGNRVQNSIIGDTLGNVGAGIIITNSSLNIIGGGLAIKGNTIGANTAYGIQISGGGSHHNIIGQNLIGEKANGVATPNKFDGVMLDLGAFANQVGGELNESLMGGVFLFRADNRIANNGGSGVAVLGASTIGNSVLYNSISRNVFSGIENASGGNHDLPTPVRITYDGTSISGNVDVTKVPAGSTVQVFGDPGLQGARYRGETIVLPGGAWIIDPLFAAPAAWKITMTATSPDGSTTEFGSGVVTVEPGFSVARIGVESVLPLPPGRTNHPALRLALAATGSAVMISGVSFQLSQEGLVSSDFSGLSLYLDANGDGMISLGDSLLAGPVKHSLGTPIQFTLPNVVLQPNAPQAWIVAAAISANAFPGTRFQLTLAAPQAFNAVFSSGGPAPAIGSFPINSATNQIIEASLFSLGQWKTKYFSAAQLADQSVSGNTADPRHIGLINLLAYAYNIDPLKGDPTALLSTGSGVPRGDLRQLVNPATQRAETYFVISFLRRRDSSDLIYSLDGSLGLPAWIGAAQANGYLVEAGKSQVGDGSVELVTYRSAKPVLAVDAPKKFITRVGVQLVP